MHLFLMPRNCPLKLNQIAVMLRSWNDDHGKSPILALKNGLAQLSNSQEEGNGLLRREVLILESCSKAWKDQLSKAE